MSVTNEWNRNNRFSVAYIDANGNTGLDMNIYVDGTTRENLESHIIQFREDVSRWMRILTAPRQDQARPLGEPRAGI